MNNRKAMVIKALLMVVVLMAGVSCSKKSTETDNPAETNIEIMGTWAGLIGEEQDEIIVISFTNTNLTAEMAETSEDTQRANIVYFNNDNNTLIAFWTEHPAGSEFVGKYMKIVWSAVDSNTTSIQPYTPQATQAEANSTTSTEGFNAVVLEKVPANTLPTPTFSPPGGTSNETISVSISCSTVGATIHYTTDGSEPTATSPTTQPIPVSSTLKLKAKAFKAGMSPSFTTSATYTNTNPVSGMVLVEGGTFMMGSENETPVHQVSVSSFHVGRFEVMQSEYANVMGNNPSHFPGLATRPVEQVSWYQAIEYCNRRSMLEGLTPCYSYLADGTDPDNWPSGWDEDDDNHPNVSCNWLADGYRLLTEAEWEFAARGGNNAHGYTYSGSNSLNSVAWHSDNSDDITQTVGTKLPNELNIYDMSGNVFEWVWDIGAVDGTYPTDDLTDPHGASSGWYRIVRGGSWRSSSPYCMVTNRTGGTPTQNNTDTGGGKGFRIARRYQ